MDVDLGTESQVNDFTTVPQGTYLCEVTDVRPTTTRNGDERWSMRLVVAEGEYVGRQAAWDSLVFSSRGLARVRQILGALGLPNRGKVQLEPSDLEGRRALVEVRPAAYENADGVTVRRNEVPYDGFRPVPEDPDGATRNGNTRNPRDHGDGNDLDAIPF